MVDSVLMLTTAGSSCFAICVNELESCFGSGTVRGVASAETFLSCPRTLYEITVPIRIPTASVRRINKDDPGRWPFTLFQKALTRAFIDLSSTYKNKIGMKTAEVRPPDIALAA